MTVHALPQTGWAETQQTIITALHRGGYRPIFDGATHPEAPWVVIDEHGVEVGRFDTLAACTAVVHPARLPSPPAAVGGSPDGLGGAAPCVLCAAFTQPICPDCLGDHQ